MFDFQLDQETKGLKIGLLKEGFDICLDECVATTVKKTAMRLNEYGYVITDVSVPQHKNGGLLDHSNR